MSGSPRGALPPLPVPLAANVKGGEVAGSPRESSDSGSFHVPPLQERTSSARLFFSSIAEDTSKIAYKVSLKKAHMLHSQNTPLSKKLMFVFGFPLISVVFLATYLIPMAEVSCEEFWDNWVSQLVVTPLHVGIICASPVTQLSMFLQVDMPVRAHVTTALVSAALAVVIVLLIGGVGGIFPIPFLSVVVYFPCWITGIGVAYLFVPKIQRRVGAMWRKVKVSIVAMNLFLIMIGVWCAYAVLFRSVASSAQTLLAAFLPVMKWFTKLFFDRFMLLISPDLGVAVVFVFEYFNAIFVASLYLNVVALETVVLIIIMDVIGNVYMLSRVCGFPSVFDVAWILVCGTPPERSDTESLISELASSSKRSSTETSEEEVEIVRAPATQPHHHPHHQKECDPLPAVVEEQNQEDSVPRANTDRKAAWVQQHHGPGLLGLPEDVQRQFVEAHGIRARLRSAELLAIQEYVECFVGWQVALFIIIAYWGPNRGSFVGLDGDTPPEDVSKALEFIAVSAAAELILFVLVVVFVNIYLKIDLLQLLYTNLIGNLFTFASYQGTLLLYIFGLILKHNGNDFSFKFECIW